VAVADRRARGVIFDCDGVLVDSEPIANAVLVEDLARRGLVLEASAVDHLFLGSTMAAVGDRARALGANLPDSWIGEIYDALYARLRAGTPPVPGIFDLLDRLDAAAIPYAVASNGSPEKMEITLGQTGLWPRFEGRMLSAHVEGVAKPDPELLRRAAARINRLAEECVLIGDSLADCLAARGAGMHCVALVHHGDGSRLAAEGAQVVRSLAEAAREIGL
jgi:HAD superfamily hydrolase (TIGR01509 family)